MFNSLFILLHFAKATLVVWQSKGLTSGITLPTPQHILFSDYAEYLLKLIAAFKSLSIIQPSPKKSCFKKQLFQLSFPV